MKKPSEKKNACLEHCTLSSAYKLPFPNGGQKGELLLCFSKQIMRRLQLDAHFQDLDG